MLTNLLPGVREVRTPLAVGYLWLVAGWLIWGEQLPLSRPPGDGLIARVFDLGTGLGSAIVLAALSFAAYTIGAVLTLPVEVGVIEFLLRISAPDTRTTQKETSDCKKKTKVSKFRERLASVATTPEEDAARSEFEDHLAQLQRRATTAGLSPEKIASLGAEPRASELRIRLLTASNEVYGEYDRLTAEGSFRINVCLPLTAIIVVGSQVSAKHGILLGLVPIVLLAVQGLNRLRFARRVLWRSATTGLVKLPAEAALIKAEGPQTDTSIA